MIKDFLKLVLFRFTYLISYIAIVGISLFFHFQLGHQMSEIENWLYFYSGTILIVIVLVRFLFVLLLNDKTIIYDKKSEFIQMLNHLGVDFYSIILLIMFFLNIYFSSKSELFEITTRVQSIPRFISLLFVIIIDIFSSSLFLSDKNSRKFFQLGLFDCFIAVIGIYLFHQNLHLSLMIVPFYIGSYFLLLITKNNLSLFFYWLFILLPLSGMNYFKVDVFSVDYVEIFSIFVVFIAHLIPYIWLIHKKEEPNGKSSIRYFGINH